jgi:branched-chain amino acid transport system substrate-binding protein
MEVLMSRRALSLVLLLALVLSVAPGITAQEENPVRIGVVTSETGSQARFGEAQLRGYDLALEAINSAGGVLGRPVELVIMDDTSEPETAQLMVERLITEEEVSVIIGSYSSSATLPAVGVANDYEVPIVVPTAATDAITQQGYEWVFRICAPSSVYASTMLDFLVEFGAIENVAVIYENTAFGSSTSEAVVAYADELGIEVVANEAYEAGSPDYRPILTRVKDSDPQAIFFVSYLADATLLMQQAEELDINVDAFAAGGAGFSLPDFPANAGPNAEFTLSVTQWTPDTTWPGSADFTKAFVEAYDIDPQYHSAETYAALFVVADAIERAGTADDPEAIRDALRETDLDTIFGPIQFDETGQNSHPMLVTQVLQGQFVTVWPAEAAAMEPIYPAPTWEERDTFEYPDMGM